LCDFGAVTLQELAYLFSYTRPTSVRRCSQHIAVSVLSCSAWRRCSVIFFALPTWMTAVVTPILVRSGPDWRFFNISVKQTIIQWHS